MGKASDTRYEKLLHERIDRFNSNKEPAREGEEPCSACKNKGYTIVDIAGYFTYRECDCISFRKKKDALQLSGMYELLMRHSFENFSVAQPWQNAIVNRVFQCLPTEKWLMLCGQSGCGKTHLASAMCRELVRLGKKVQCMRWPEAIKAICASRFDLSHREKLMEPFLNAPVLLIDDMFKSRLNANGLPEISAAELDATFEIISHRYDLEKRTLITTELPSGTIKALSEALYGRICQRAGQFVLNISRAEDRNWRLKCLS